MKPVYVGSSKELALVNIADEQQLFQVLPWEPTRWRRGEKKIQNA